MVTILPSQKASAASLSFDVGSVRVTVFPSLPGQLARFLLHRSTPALPNPSLIGSGSAHDTVTCVEQATRAARRALAMP